MFKLCAILFGMMIATPALAVGSIIAAAIIGASFLPLRIWAQQGLVLFALLWFYVMLFTEVLGK